MGEKKAFIVPVVVDGTSERGASVPDKFRDLQWTHLSGGQTSPAFVERVLRLLSPDAPPTRAAAVRSGSTTLPLSAPSVRESSMSKPTLRVASAVVAVALGYFVVDKFSISKQLKQTIPPAQTAAEQAPQRSGAAPAKEVTFNPPPHSVAVLPFVNMSGDKEQEYFSEGLTEELLNSVSHVSELQVAARTSSFSLQGEHPDIATVAQKLNVGVVLEGSVRRSANTVRITAQLVNGATGFHLWSETYDRDLRDVLKLQTEIATAVASALKVTLLSDEAAKIDVGGTPQSGGFRCVSSRDEGVLGRLFKRKR